MSIRPEELGRALEEVMRHVTAKAQQDGQVLLAAATEGARIIKRRTQAEGLDRYGKPFKAYSAPYARWRKEVGRGDKPNLTVTSSMMNSMVVRSSPSKAEIYFEDRPMALRPRTKLARKRGKRGVSGARLVMVPDVASYHAYGEGKNPQRDFAGIEDRPQDVKAVGAAAERQLQKILASEGP